MAPTVKHAALDFGSGRDLPVRGLEPHPGLCADGAEPAWGSLSLPLSLPLPCSLLGALCCQAGSETLHGVFDPALEAAAGAQETPIPGAFAT